MSILAALTMEKLIHMIFCWKRFCWNWKLLCPKKKIYEKTFFMCRWICWNLCGLDKGTPSEDNIKFNLRYSEGFPCFIDPGKTELVEVEIMFISYHLFQQFPIKPWRFWLGHFPTELSGISSWGWGSWDPYGVSREYLTWNTVK